MIFYKYPRQREYMYIGSGQIVNALLNISWNWYNDFGILSKYFKDDDALDHSPRRVTNIREIILQVQILLLCWS